MNRSSRIFAGLLAGLGLFLIAVSLLMLYVGRNLVRDDLFAQRVSESLDDPRVAEYVALEITNAVIAQQPDLTAVRPILVVVTRGVVASDPFRAMVRPAVRQAHRALLSSAAENIMLAAPDAGVLVREALEAVGSTAAERLPPRLEPLMEVQGASPALRVAGGVMNLIGVLRPLGRIGLLAGLLCLVAAVLVSPTKRSTMLAVGVGVTTVGVLLGLSVLASRVLAPAAILDPAAAAAAVGVSVAFLGPLRIVGIIVAVVGAAVAVAALPGDGLDPAKLRGDLWHLVSSPRPRALAEVVRLTAVGAAGLIALFSPSLALSVAAVGGGALILLLAFTGWRRLIQPYMPLEILGTTEQVRVAPVAWAGARVVILVALGIGAAALILRVRPQPEILLASAGTCNGAVELCERPLNEVVFPGAHNAMGSALNPSWLFPNQDIDLRASLERGVRAFLLDPYRGNRIGDAVRTDFDAVAWANRKIEEVIGPEAWAAGMRVREQLVGEPGPSEVFLCHGFCEFGALRMADELRIFVDFLATHPGEVIIIDFEDYTSVSDIAGAFEESGLIDYVYRGPLGPAWPTLGEMVASGGRVLVITENDTGGLPWLHLAWEGLMAETPYTFRTVEEFSCLPNRGTPTGGLFLVNHWIETTPTPRPSNAQIVNQREFLVERLRRCQSERGMTANIIAVDFAGIGDVVGAARELNGLQPLTTLP